MAAICGRRSLTGGSNTPVRPARCRFPRSRKSRPTRGKSNVAPALPSDLGHMLTDDRHGLVVNVQCTGQPGE
ncbi:hypothetical protein DIE11_08080 [Burkholderia sp. Bp9012]|nr:hypothetical protein DIE11_08080 [Burkholderia sp. Bp9012]